MSDEEKKKILDPLDGRLPIGKVGSPSGKEATSDQFYFWVDRKALVEVGQIVRVTSVINSKEFTFFALVEQVYRVSDKSSIADEYGATDGNSDEETVTAPVGVSYASSRILRTYPVVFTAPMEQSKVYLCTNKETEAAYAADENKKPLALGMIKNGGDVLAGMGRIDLEFLNGVNGGHMNVSGVAGRGTKSSFLLFTIYMMLREAQHQKEEDANREGNLQVVPIILNVKGFDLFFLDHRNSGYNPKEHDPDWNDLGVDDPQPFKEVRFYAPEMPAGGQAVNVNRAKNDVIPYSWSLSDIIENELLIYLFGSEDVEDNNFSALLLDIEDYLTKEDTLDNGDIKRVLKPNSAPSAKGELPYGTKTGVTTDSIPQTFEELADWVKIIGADPGATHWGSHHAGTWRKLHRRLIKLLHEGSGVLRRSDLKGSPLKLIYRQTVAPIVVDLNSLSRVPSLQRFVVATIISQILEERTGPNAINGLIYLIALDELNRFAPRGAKDPITLLVERVAAEMRSAGVILLGAQQQASKISERVFENSAIRVVGRSGPLEMSQPIWKFMNDKMRQKAVILKANEKLVVQDTFLEPMHIRVPFPVWAMNRDSAVLDSARPPYQKKIKPV